jgi:glycosyltransferase involved in cell wall biosynthesis
MSEVVPQENQNDERRRVVFIEGAAAMGGVQFSTLYVAQNLSSDLWQPVVLCPQDGDLPAACRRLGIAVEILAQPKLRSTSFRIRNDVRLPNPAAWLWDGAAMLVTMLRVKRFLAKNKPSLVVTKGLFPHLYGSVPARSVGIPCIWHVQDLISERFFALYRRAFALTARLLPDHVIADGAAIARQLPGLKNRTSVILNGVDCNVFRPGREASKTRQEFGVPADAFVIGHVGRMTPWKGQQYLLEAFAQVAAAAPRAYLVFVGDPVFDTDAYQRKLVELAARLGLTERVKFVGYRHDLPEVLAALDVFAFTSVEKDTSPLTLLSALAAGLPIVAFDIEGVRELVTEGKPLLLTPLKDLEALAAALLRLIAEPELRRRLGSLARRHAENNFSLEQHIARVEQIFREVAQHRRSVFRETGAPDHGLVNGGTIAKHSLRP